MGRVRHAARTEPRPATTAASTIPCAIPRFMIGAPSQKRAQSAHDDYHGKHAFGPRRSFQSRSPRDRALPVAAPIGTPVADRSPAQAAAWAGLVLPLVLAACWEHASCR